MADGRYSDGRTAGSRPVHLAFDGRHISVREADGSTSSHSLAEAIVIAPVGGGPWRIELPGHAEVTFHDAALGDSLLAADGRPSLMRVLEAHWHWALAAVAVAACGTWLVLGFAVPVAARHLAAAVPPNIEHALRRESLRIIDGWIFSPSELPEDTRSGVRALFDEITRSDPALQSFELEFRASRVGPNAFALPGGVVVMTDELVLLSGNDAELVAVLAHEVGHLAHDHSLRILLQNSASALFIAGVTGDITDITALSATIPTVLMQAKYSREFEREADEFAFDYLETSGRSADALRDLLLRIEASVGDSDAVPSWISTHPRTEERARAE